MCAKDYIRDRANIKDYASDMPNALLSGFLIVKAARLNKVYYPLLTGFVT